VFKQTTIPKGKKKSMNKKYMNFTGIKLIQFLNKFLKNKILKNFSKN